MRWPWRRERTAGPRHALPRQRATWAQPALPPPLEAATPVMPAAAGDSAFPAEVVAVRPTVEAATADVRLGFADGSEVTLGAADPRAVALRAVADVLVRGEM